MKSKWIALFGIAAAALAATAWVDDTPYLVAREAAVAPGKEAPKFEAKLMSGKDIKFPEAYKGKIVLVDFWATWCPPCRAEVPHIVKTYQTHGGEHFAVLSISLDASRKRTAEQVTKYATDNKMAWDHVYEGVDAYAEAYGVTGIPAAFLIDADTGKILAMEDDLRGENLLKKVETAVKKKAAKKD